MIYLDSFEKLSRMLKPVLKEQDANAAVALILKPMNKDFGILFVKRVENPDDPWSGQVAFPGGKSDAADQSLRHTIIREVLEETNIDLVDCCCFLGVLDPLRSIQKPEMKILPFVFLLKHEPQIRLNEEELEESVWLSLEELAQRKSTISLSSGEVPAFVVGSTVIWGLTYRILESFLHAL